MIKWRHPVKRGPTSHNRVICQVASPTKPEVKSHDISMVTKTFSCQRQTAYCQPKFLKVIGIKNLIKDLSVLAVDNNTGFLIILGSYIALFLVLAQSALHSITPAG